jgi:hypothetical protein
MTDTPAASKDAPTDEVVDRFWFLSPPTPQAVEGAMDTVASHGMASATDYVEAAQILARHVATLTAQLEAERALQAEAEAEANEVGIRYGFANAQTEIADLNDRLTRETARADAAEKEAKALREELDWRPIETAPKDGTPILAWCVHPHARYVGDPKEWSCTVVTHWINHNGGGWTWNGMAGRFTHWRPVGDGPDARATLAQPAGEKP